MVTYSSHVRQYGFVQKFVRVNRDREGIAMTVFNRLSMQYKTLITTLNVIENDKDLFSLEFVKSRIL